MTLALSLVQIAFTTRLGLSLRRRRQVAPQWRAVCLLRRRKSLPKFQAASIREIYMVIRLVVSRAAVGLFAMGLGVAVSGGLRPGQCAEGMRISISGQEGRQ